jgi:hypothetical protein
MRRSSRGRTGSRREADWLSEHLTAALNGAYIAGAQDCRKSLDQSRPGRPRMTALFVLQILNGIAIIAGGSALWFYLRGRRR